MSFVVFESNNVVPFYESLSLKISTHLQNKVEICQLKNGNVNIVPSDSVNSIPFRRPSFCPFANLKEHTTEDLPDVKHKSIAVACVVMLENKYGQVLLTRRSAKLRTFPNVWVSPGGHVDKEENIEAAALRELSEETGLNLSIDDVELNLLCAWESSFPNHLKFGLPKYHNFVLYYGAKIKNTDFDFEKLVVSIDEVNAYCWLDKAKVASIVRTFEDPLDLSLIECYGASKHDALFECFEVQSSQDNLTYQKVLRPMSVLTATTSNNLGDERVSTATKYSLYEWLIFSNK